MLFQAAGRCVTFGLLADGQGEVAVVTGVLRCP